MTLESYLESKIRNIQEDKVSIYDRRFFVYALCGFIGSGIFIYIFGGPVLMIVNFFLTAFGKNEVPFTFSPEFSDVASKVYVFCMCFAFLIFFFLHGVLRDQKKWRFLVREYKKKFYEGFVFHSEEYKQAAEALRKFRLSSYEDAIQKYDKNIVDILVLAKSVAVVDKYPLIQRIVSIKSIEEDREAGWEDDEAGS